jgi:hypothetical protein
MNTVASVLAAPSSTISIWKVACYIGPNGSSKVAYSASVRSIMNGTDVTSMLNSAVVNGNFASKLSSFSGILLSSVIGNFTLTVSSAAIMTAPETSSGKSWQF